MKPGPILEIVSQHRRAIRYKLKLPVLFHWNDGAEHVAGGFTSDVALDGVLILSSTCPPIGCEVRIEILTVAAKRYGSNVLEELPVWLISIDAPLLEFMGCLTTIILRGRF